MAPNNTQTVFTTNINLAPHNNQQVTITARTYKPTTLPNFGHVSLGSDAVRNCIADRIQSRENRTYRRQTTLTWQDFLTYFGLTHAELMKVTATHYELIGNFTLDERDYFCMLNRNRWPSALTTMPNELTNGWTEYPGFN